jgi:hypothetical protein
MKLWRLLRPNLESGEEEKHDNDNNNIGDISLTDDDFIMSDIDDYRDRKFKGRDARLFKEWESIDSKYGQRGEVFYLIRKRNPAGLPTVYEVVFKIHSFCGVEEADANGLQKPIYADRFVMRINIPNNYPSVDAKLEFKFVSKSVTGQEIPHPWHPNIRYYGDFAGRVCLNVDACGAFTDLAWYINRVAQYLRYETYHARIGVPPFPEDDAVAQWITEQGEPQGWVEQLQQYHASQS